MLPGSKEPGFCAEDRMKSKEGVSEIHQNGLGNPSLTVEQINDLKRILKTKLNTVKDVTRGSEIILDDQILYGPVRESIVDLYMSLCQKDLASLPAQLAMAWQLHRVVVEAESNLLKAELVNANEALSSQLEAFQKIQEGIQELELLCQQGDRRIKKEFEFIERQFGDFALKERIQVARIENLTVSVDQGFQSLREAQLESWKFLRAIFLMNLTGIISGFLLAIFYWVYLR